MNGYLATRVVTFVEYDNVLCNVFTYLKKCQLFSHLHCTSSFLYDWFTFNPQYFYKNILLSLLTLEKTTRKKRSHDVYNLTGSRQESVETLVIEQSLGTSPQDLSGPSRNSGELRQVLQKGFTEPGKVSL